jgi:hypothetical protein
MRTSATLAILLVTAGCYAEIPERANTAGFSPPGDPIAGKKVFQEMRCWACHEIYGSDMPKPVATPPVPVYLGGNAIPAPNELYLLRAVVTPSHQLAPGWSREAIAVGDRSRMGDFSDAMTARQLFDVIAFLRSRYGENAEKAVRQQASLQF